MQLPALFNNNILQIVFRCIAVYAFVVIAIRIFGKKELAQLSVIDLVFILLISNSVQNAMVGSDSSLLGGVVAATALFCTNNLLKRLLYRNKEVSEWLQGEAVMLVYKGNVLQKNLAYARITFEELEAAVREHGIASVSEVDLAMLEVDGNVSVVSNDFKKRTNHTMAGMQHRKKHRLKGKII